MSFLNRFNEYFLTHHARYIHAFKYAIAFSLGYLAMLLFNDHYSFWILVTIAVVMSSQPVVGQLIRKSFYRILGTVVGLLFGIGMFLVPQDPWLIFFMVGVVSFLMAYLFSFKSEEVGQIGVLGMVTFVLITFLSKDSVHFALMRVLDTFVGISISCIVSLFIFPMTTRRSMMITFLSSCAALHQFIDLIFIDGRDRRVDPEINTLENQVIQSLSKLRNAVRSRRYETLWTASSVTQREEMNELIRYLRAIYHYLLYIDVALSEISDSNSDLAIEARGLLLPRMQKLSEVFAQVATDKSSLVRRIYYKPFSDIQFPEKYRSQYYAIDFALRRIPFCLHKMEVARKKLQL